MRRIQRSIIIGFIITGLLSYCQFSKKYAEPIALRLVSPETPLSKSSDQFYRKIRPLIDTMNSWMVLERPIRVIIKENEEPIYDPQSRTIIMGLDPIYEAKEMLPGSEYSVLSILLFHELGHALIHELNIMELTNQEIMADTFATVFAIESFDNPKMVYEYALFLDKIESSIYSSP